MRSPYFAFKQCMWVVLVAALASFLTGCPVDHRIVAVYANPPSISPPTSQDYLNAAILVYNAGARGTIEQQTWSVLEPSPYQYSLVNLQNELNFYSTEGLTTYLLIKVIDTVAREVPPDLATVNWDDPQMESRFHSLLDTIRPLLTPQVRYISIGNEVDVYLTNHPLEWVAYQTFYEDALNYIHQTMPGIQVGVTTTFGGASAGAKANVAALNNMSDVWILTYYPLGPGWIPLAPQSPLVDFPSMLALAGTKQIVLQEVGYPSSALLSSSEANQATFVQAVFLAWQQNDAIQRIPFLSFFVLHDLTPSICSELNAYYQLPPDPALQAYLCSLGLRHSDGTIKPGWTSFVGTAAAEGFPH
jgi:hypothetical protein